MVKKRLRTTILCLLPWLLSTAPSLSAAGAPVTATADWSRHGGNYANHRFSELRQIDHSNVARLKAAWIFETGKAGSFQATPIVEKGIMYVTTPWNEVLALNAVSGKELWRYRHQLTTKNTCCGPANRGAAVAYGKVYTATIDSRLLALDQATGKVAWDVPITDPNAGRREVLTPLLGESDFQKTTVVGGTGYSANMAPQVYDGKYS